jgi:uncharacterized protein (TIGR00299 family) protein
MALGALLDCGVPLDKLRAGLSSLPVHGWDIRTEPILKNGIHAVSVTITLDGMSDEEELANQSSDHAHVHEDGGHHHEHDKPHVHSHEHSHEHEHAHPHVHGRSMREIRELIEASELSECVKTTSLKIFGVIAEAEAKMHHSTPEEVHFHEIGGVDSLIDIVGVAWCLDYLGVDEVYCSALPHSSGHVHCAHGIMPVPAPATSEMLKGAPFFPTGLQGEMITPTGAGIVAALSLGFGSPPAFVPQHVGAGAGKKNFADRPNLLRVIVGEKTQSSTQLGETRSQLQGLDWQTLSLIETNIDDMNPELWDSVFVRLFAAGALDVWLEPVHMKKNRPAQVLHVLSEAPQRDAIISAILRDTTTLGIRLSEVQRASMPRSIETVQTQWGEVRLKVARWNEGSVERAMPEYDDVARLAREHNVAAREIYLAAQGAFAPHSSTSQH